MDRRTDTRWQVTERQTDRQTEIRQKDRPIDRQSDIQTAGQNETKKKLKDLGKSGKLYNALQHVILVGTVRFSISNSLKIVEN